MASKDAFVFSQPALVTCSFTTFYDMKTKGELSDVSIKIDNKIFSLHRIILAAAVPYFRTMFTSNLAESRDKEVTMKGLDPIALECLIDFAYTSKVTITIENVPSLLVASEYLQLTQVRDSCCDFLSKRLDPNNVMSVRALAHSLNCLSLVKNAESYIRKHFDVFSQTKGFLSLSFPFLNELIRKDDLQVSSEEKVFDAVMSWVKTDRNRHEMLPGLLTGVRMTFLTPQFLIKKVSKEKLIMDSVPCRNLLDEAKHYHLLPEEGEGSDCSFTVSERCYGTGDGSGIYLFSCGGSDGLTIFKYIATTGKWNTVLKDKWHSDLRHVLALGDEIYTFSSSTFETFNPRTLTWTPRATFPSSFQNFEHAVPCNGVIYWFGNSQNPCQGIYFNNQQNQWVSYAHRNLSIYSDDVLVPSGNTVYVFGSNMRLDYTGRRNVKYNLQLSALSEISQMQNKRYAFASAVLGDTVYVCGGISQSYRDPFLRGRYFRCDESESSLRSTEIYNFPRRWRTVSSMCKPRKNFSLLSYNKQLYAIGGNTETAGLVEVYDPAADKWTLIGGSLDRQFSFVKAVAICGEKNLLG